MLSTDERVPDLERRKATEVAVGAPQLADPVEKAQGGDARVVHARSFDPAVLEKGSQAPPVAGRFAHGHEAR